MIDGAEIERRFDYHGPAGDQDKIDRHHSVRDTFRMAALRMIDTIPPGREQSLVITKLEEAMMWANAAIARPQPPSFDARDRQDTPKPE